MIVESHKECTFLLTSRSFVGKDQIQFVEVFPNVQGKRSTAQRRAVLIFKRILLSAMISTSRVFREAVLWRRPSQRPWQMFAHSEKEGWDLGHCSNGSSLRHLCRSSSSFTRVFNVAASGRQPPSLQKNFTHLVPKEGSQPSNGGSSIGSGKSWSHDPRGRAYHQQDLGVIS